MYFGNILFFNRDTRFSGKSTFAKALNCKIVCPDDIRISHRISHGAHSQRAFQIAREEIATTLKSGKDVVFDATNTIARWRKETIDFAKQHTDKVVCILMDTDFFECLCRHRNRKINGVRISMPDKVIYRMASQLRNNSPSISEGFDEIISSSEFQK